MCAFPMPDRSAPPWSGRDCLSRATSMRKPRECSAVDADSDWGGHKAFLSALAEHNRESGQSAFGQIWLAEVAGAAATEGGFRPCMLWESRARPREGVRMKRIIGMGLMATASAAQAQADFCAEVRNVAAAARETPPFASVPRLPDQRPMLGHRVCFVAQGSGVGFIRWFDEGARFVCDVPEDLVRDRGLDQSRGPDVANRSMPSAGGPLRLRISGQRRASFRGTTSPRGGRAIMCIIAGTYEGDGQPTRLGPSRPDR